MKRITSSLIVFLATLTPVISFAQTPRNFGDVVKLFVDLLLRMVPVVFGLAILVFFWGLAKFILHADNEDKREEGKQVMKWGIVALVVMVSLWAIVTLVSGEFGITLRGLPLLPVLPVSQ